MYDLRDELVLAEFREFQRKRGEPMNNEGGIRGPIGFDHNSKQIYRGNPVATSPSSYISSASASPPGEVVRAMHDLQDQTDRLHASLRMLKDKIGSTLTPEGPSDNGVGCGAIGPNISEHADAIRVQVRTVSNACDLVENMIARTEL
jgi:hypothetical protein